MSATYPANVELYIDGAWCTAAADETIPVRNPATDAILGTVSHARRADLERAVAAAERGFELWRRISPLERAKRMRKASLLLRERARQHRMAPIPPALPPAPRSQRYAPKTQAAHVP